MVAADRNLNKPCNGFVSFEQMRLVFAGGLAATLSGVSRSSKPQ